jgi:hypothetical protein
MAWTLFPDAPSSWIGLCVHVSRWRLSHSSSSVCMSLGGDCCLHHSILGALRTCLQVETVAFVIVGVHVSSWGLPPSSLYSGGSAYMSPGGDCHICHCQCARLQAGTAAFVIVFWGCTQCLQAGTVAFVIVGVHVSSWGLPPSSLYFGGSAYVFLKLSTITSIFHGLSDAFVQTSIKQRLCFFICT